MTYHHGVEVIEITEGERPIQVVSTAVIGIVATGADADATLFPLNKAALITDLPAAIGKAGTTGTLAKALQAIYDQTQAVVVVVRVTAGADAAATSTAVIGGNVAGVATGMQVLLSAEAQVGVRPRILGCPGLDTQAVATALATVAQKLRAMAYVYANGADVAAVLAYRENFSQREVMVLWPDFTAFDTATSTTVAASSVARALGLRARIDAEQGWHKTLSNVAVNGVTGVSKDISWDLQDPATDAGLLNAGQVTTLVRQNGFRFWGSRTCSDEPLFAFESATRTAQVLADTIANGVAAFLDKPLHPSLAKDIIASINATFRSLKAGGYIVDGRAWLNDSANTTAALCDGQLHIDYDFTPVPPLEQLKLRQRITTSYLANFAAQVAG
ncbi:MAG: phage tail sheath subtilisin-like domain-containing protein [Caulobacter sp.]|nr:phage tail sheath subtilisin-like domain-containing protein [Caulobacter sp.]